MDMHLLGKWGEQMVGRQLEEAGWRIVEYNYRGSQEEIDVIAEDGVYLLFVEVKTRSANAMSLGIEAVTKAKQSHLRRCAQHFLMSVEGEEYQDLQPRFDVADVIAAEGEPFTVLKFDYYENAF